MNLLDHYTVRPLKDYKSFKSSYYIYIYNYTIYIYVYIHVYNIYNAAKCLSLQLKKKLVANPELNIGLCMHGIIWSKTIFDCSNWFAFWLLDVCIIFFTPVVYFLRGVAACYFLLSVSLELNLFELIAFVAIYNFYLITYKFMGPLDPVYLVQFIINC